MGDERRRLGDGDDLHLVPGQRHEIAHSLAHHGAGKWRYIADAALVRIGFIIANDRIGLDAAIGAFEADAVAKADAVSAGARLDKLRRGAPG